MATFTLTIDTDNAAFSDEDTGDIDTYSASREIARLLRRAADRIGEGDLTASYGVREGHTRNLLDVNGNIVGTYRLK